MAAAGRYRRGIRAAAAERRQASGTGDALKSGDNRHLAQAERRAAEIGVRDRPRSAARRGEIVGDDRHRQLPGQGPGGHAQVAQGHGQKSGGHLLAGGHDRVVFVIVGAKRRVGRPRPIGPGHQFIGLAGHGRDDHGRRQAGAGLVPPPRVVGDAADALEDSSFTTTEVLSEFHHQTRYLQSLKALRARTRSEQSRHKVEFALAIRAAQRILS